MREYDVSQINPWTYLLTLVLVGLLVLISPLSIFNSSEVRAQSDNLSSENVSLSENITHDNPPLSDNSTLEQNISSDNTTPTETAPSDNLTIEIPPSSENATPEIITQSENITPEDLSVTENVTPEIQLESDNMTPEDLLPIDNFTFEFPLPTQIIRVVNPDEEVQMQSATKKIELNIPKGAVSAPVKFELTECSPLVTTGMRMVNLIDFDASLVDSKEKVDRFDKELVLTIKHSPEELAGLDIDSLHLYYLNEETLQWVPVPSTLDRDTLILTATITHFSYYGEQANPLQNGPGRVMASQVNLHSGAATFSYPFELPPGPGGFQPSLTLTYNSGSVDEMKNKRDVGSWVGIGWSLQLNRISYNEGNNRYYLELNGVSYQLIAGENNIYYTKPDKFLKIVRNSNTWEVLDTEGSYYRFGGTTDSQQYHDTNVYYCWNLSYWKDTNGNEADVTYTQDIKSNTVRSAYPSILSYDDDKVRIYFNSSFDYTSDDGNMRYDTPKGNTQNPAPKIVENKKLDSIEIKVYTESSWNLLRKYCFTYNSTNATESYDYGPIWYAGTYTLYSITQKDKNDSLTLPATTFTYENKQIYAYDTIIWDYVGNPGNPASLYWPHLTGVTSGYGANITFSYTQIPDTSVSDIWTRQVVTSKTVVPGIGATENYTYSYTGYPQYMNGHDLSKAEFRGFTKVRETDAAGNYVDHYFNTVDPNDGDAEKLTGLETKTEWYDSSDNLIRRVENSWGWDYTASAYSLLREWNTDTGNSLLYPFGIAISSDGYILVVDMNNHLIRKFSSNGDIYAILGGYGSGDGEFNYPTCVAVDSNGNIYVADTQNHRIQKFTSNGTFVTKWGTQGSGNGQFSYPYGIATDSNNYVYVVDRSNNRIQKFTSSGTYVTKWGTQGSGDGQFSNPLGIDISSDDYIYVSESGNSRIQKFTNTGTFVTKWGTQGTGNGQFKVPIGVAVDANSYVYVADRDNYRIQKFTSTGAFVTKWGTQGTGDGQFNRPYGVAVSSENITYVTDTWACRIQKFTSTGTFLAVWGGDYIKKDGQFNYPTDILSSDGYFYVVDQMNNRIQKFTNNGTFMTKWGTQGSGDGQFYNPTTIAIDSSGYIYVADYQNHRIQKFTNGGTFMTKWGTQGTGCGQFMYPWGIAVDSDDYVYVADTYNNRIQKFTSTGTFVTTWGTQGTGYFQFYSPSGITATDDGYVYIADRDNSRITKYTNTGTFICKWGTQGSGDGQFNIPFDVDVDDEGYVYVVEQNNHRVQKFTDTGTFVTKWGSQGSGDSQFDHPIGIDVDDDVYIFIVDRLNNRIVKYTQIYSVHLSQVEEITYNSTSGNQTSRTRYEYDNYGNVITQYLDGDISTNDDDATIHRVFYPNTTDNILSKPARERVYSGIQEDGDSSANLTTQTLYYYDDNDWDDEPEKGNLTRHQASANATDSISSYFTYDSYGNMLTSMDPENNTTTWTYETTYHTYPATKTYPVSGLSESYTYDPGTNNLLTVTDVNGQTTTYEYDTFKRLTKVIKPGDTSGSPSIEYNYNSWGTINQQNIETITKIDAGDTIWQKEYFDGLGRIVQVHAEGETGHTIIVTTTTHNNRGLVDKEYVSQDIASVLTSYYTTGIQNWKHSTYTYDGLGRVVTQTAADGSSVSHDYSSAWQDLVMDPNTHYKRYYYDAFRRLIKVEEMSNSTTVYATTEYEYDVLGNLTQVEDDDGNTTTMTYDWLSRKMTMTDPDMGSWSYSYDDNGNLTTQTDAKSQTITMTYDDLNRLIDKEYPVSANMTDVSYSYDSITGGNYGKGQRTGMMDDIGTTTYKYDTRGRLIEEKRTIDDVDYVTKFGYDGADRNTWILYPTGENVTQTYNGRGFPYSLSGSVAGDIVDSTLYNNLGQITDINLENGLTNSFEYWGIDHGIDSYGRLWRINVGNLMDVRHTWDAGGNLVSRYDAISSDNESFSYDFLDRLTGVSGAYSRSYTYSEIGNILTRNGVSYSYDSTQPHAVDSVGATSYYYDANGNMTDRGNQDIVWDAENRPVSVSENGTTAYFWYDGDGNRVKKVEGGETVLYINKYYEVNLTTSENTSYYYLGGRLVAMKQGADLKYLHQDHLTGTALVTDTNGNSLGAMKYYPYGESRSGSVPTDKLFTGQRLDGTGLYYYNARYYDPLIGRFISPDTIVPNPMNPQEFNRYAYCLNNPLKYVDPSGHQDLALYYLQIAHDWQQTREYVAPPEAVQTIMNQPTQRKTSDCPILITDEKDTASYYGLVPHRETSLVGDDLVIIGETIGGDTSIEVGGSTIYVDTIDFGVMQIYGWTLEDIIQVENHYRPQVDDLGMLRITGIGTIPPLPDDSALTVQEMNGSTVWVDPQGYSVLSYSEYETSSGALAIYYYWHITQTIVDSYSFLFSISQ